ncbi:hypothetical protein D3C87_1900450 [compost metagenome]
MEIAVTELPVGVAVTWHGIHGHVGREQVVATMRTRFGNRIEKKIGVYALAHEAAVMVCKCNNDCLNLPSPNLARKFIQRQKSFFTH